MEVLGLILSVFVYLTVLVMLFFYLIPAFLRKFEIANSILPFFFLHSAVCCVFILCGIFMMRGGFNVTYDDSVSYSGLLFFFIPMFFLIVVMDIIVRKRTKQYDNVFLKIGRFLLPVFACVAYFAATMILYYAVHYYILLTVW